MENVIKNYVDKCLEFVQEYREYLMYVPFYEVAVLSEMQEIIDSEILCGKSTKVYVSQVDCTDYMVDIVSDRDTIWKAIDCVITDDDIIELEKELNITLPVSYKCYLKYKFFYEIFWDLNVFLYPKPIGIWDRILIENNEEMKSEILDRGYFAIGRYSDYGIVALKLKENNEEGEVVLFDHETSEIEILAPNFVEFLHQRLQKAKPVIKELKDWEKKMYKMN
ncbi:MAG: SMI1/KNR4 family protein [Flavobacteriaceae bacterium]|jgi:hypothetical protein|nr:SMI1/KNR4 family protein [Flavobacteriaceae bacterium]